MVCSLCDSFIDRICYGRYSSVGRTHPSFMMSLRETGSHERMLMVQTASWAESMPCSTRLSIDSFTVMGCSWLESCRQGTPVRRNAKKMRQRDTHTPSQILASCAAYLLGSVRVHGWDRNFDEQTRQLRRLNASFDRKHRLS